MEPLVLHCVTHKFLNKAGTQFSLLGNLLRRRIEQQWILNTVNPLGSTLWSSNSGISVKMLEDLVDAQDLMKNSGAVTFVSSFQSKNPMKINGNLCLQQTFLDSQTFVAPSRRIDEFTLLQKRRKKWWKSYLERPELLVAQNVATDELDPKIEQNIRFTSGCFNETIEELTLWKPKVFEELNVDETLKNSILVKFLGIATWPCLMTSQVRLETATCFFLCDSFSKQSVLSLHHSLAPYPVGILIENSQDPSKMKELDDLRKMLVLQLMSGSNRITVLPPDAVWSYADCDARGVPYLILLQDSTLDQGICHLRKRDTTLKEQVHVSDVVQRIKTVLSS